MKILVYGYGNPGRQDDGLGIFFSEILKARVTEEGLHDIDFDSNYQLNIEDALKISDYDTVIFADAAVEQEEAYLFRKIVPGRTIAFSTHAMMPESVLSLCDELYGKKPKAYLLTFGAKSFGINEEPTKQATDNMSGALGYLWPLLENTELLSTVQ